jgi:hypothetical protein
MNPVRSLVPPAPPRRVAVAAALAVALLILAPITARAQVLQQVPADSLVVIKINKLKPVSDRIAAFAKKLGIDQMQPALADPLGAMQKRTSITQGLDQNGEAAIVFVNGAMNEKQPPVMIFFPITDYQAFLKNFAAVKTEDQISIVKVKNDADESFVTKRGNYAVLSPKREFLDIKAAGITPAGLSAKEMATKDIVAFVNMKSARARLLPQLQQNRAKIIAEFEKNYRQGGPGGPGANRRPAVPQDGDAPAPGAAAPNAAAAAAAAQREKFLPLVRAGVNRGLDVAEQALTDADAATYGWSFGDAGLQATALLEFTPNSPSAQRVAQLKNSGDSLVKGLPQTKYWIVGGTSGNNSDVGTKLINEFVAPIEKELATLGPDGKPMQDYLAAMRTYIGNMKGQSFGWVAPQGLIGQEAILQIVSVQRGNAPVLLETAHKMFDSQQALMGIFGGPAAQQEVKTSWTANAKTIDGVAFNQMQTTFAPPPGQRPTPQQMQAQQMMTWMYGPGGINAFVAAIGNDKLVTATGATDALLKELVAAAKTDQDLLSAAPPLKSTADQLPKERLAAWFVSIDQIATSAAAYAKAFGMPINFQVPQNLAPLGGTISTDGSAIRLDGYAPTQTLQSVIAAGMQTYMQMQGGQQPGGPGGL